MEQRLPIMVWRWEEAPEDFRVLSAHGGDEDWVALLPPPYAGENAPLFLGEGGPFGCCSVSVHPLPDGSEVRIGAHA